MENHDRVMNSESLQREFPDVYRDFFARCDIVCSVPRTASWCGDHTVQRGGIRVGQKLPLRTFVGITNDTRGGVRIGQHYDFDPAKRAFIPYAFEPSFAQRLCSSLTAFAKELGGALSPGIVIHVLSEGAPHRATGTYTAFTTALAAALLIVLKRVDPGVIAGWKNTAVTQLITDPSFSFDPIFRLAWKLESISEPTIVSGGRSFTHLVHSPFPVFYFWQRLLSDFTRDTLPRWKDFSSFALLDQIPYGGASVGEFVSFRSMDFLSWPLDMSLLFCGEVATLGHGQRFLISAEESMRELGRSLQQHFQPYMKASKIIPSFYKTTSNSAALERLRHLFSISGTFALGLVNDLIALFQRGPKDETFGRFFSAFNRYQAWTSLIGAVSPLHEYLAARLHAGTHEAGFNIGLRSLTYGGSLFLLTPFGRAREWLAAFIEQLRREGRPLSLEYCSWRDGFGSEGLIVEQDLEHGIRSQHLEGDVIPITVWHRGRKESVTTSGKMFERERKRCDLFFDCVERKIFIRGKLLTSRDLHSSRKVLEIVTVLLADVGAWIPSSQLPPSSYIDRNEMQSKIVSPLRAVVRKRLKKDLRLEIRGPIGKNFTMRFDPHGLTIALRAP